MRHGTRRAPAGKGLRLIGSLAAVLAAALAAEARGQGVPTAGPFAAIHYLLDASGSMRARFGHATKLDAAREMLIALDRELEAGSARPRTSAWVYGAGSPRGARDCSDARQLARDAGPSLERLLAEVEPRGVSPLVHALESVSADSQASPEAWVVFTDGGDTCDRDPCEWAREIASRPARPRVYVVGLAVAGEDLPALSCLADATSGTVLNVGADDAWGPEIARLAAVLENRGTLRVDARVAGRPVTLQGLAFRAGFSAALRRLRTGQAEELPEGIYRVVIETVPPTVFERVRVAPGHEQVLEIDDLAQLQVRTYGSDNEPVPAYAALVAEDGGQEEVYVPAGPPTHLRPGRYRLTLEVGDSVALREVVDLAPGEVRTLVAGGTGYVAARAPELPDLSGIDVELQDYRSGRSIALQPWRGAAPVAAGEYRAVARTLPIYVQERFAIAPAETTLLEVPGLGTLEVRVTDAEGRPLGAPVTLLRPDDPAEPGGGEGSPGAVLGTFPSGVRQAVLAGTYDLLVETRPPGVRRGVRVDAGASRVVSIAVPSGAEEGI